MTTEKWVGEEEAGFEGAIGEYLGNHPYEMIPQRQRNNFKYCSYSTKISELELNL